MSELPAPAATRLQPPGWRDARLLAGLVLVLLATLLGAKAVGAADDRAPVYAAAHPLVAGDVLTAEDLRAVPVQLGEASSGYLPADAGLVQGQVVLRAVPQGELVPRSAVGPAADQKTRVVTVPVQTLSTNGLNRGGVIDLYASATQSVTGGTSTGPATTQKVLSGVTIVAVLDADSGFGVGSSTRGGQVRVPEASVAELVTLVAQDATFIAVPAGGAPQVTP